MYYCTGMYCTVHTESNLNMRVIDYHTKNFSTIPKIYIYIYILSSITFEKKYGQKIKLKRGHRSGGFNNKSIFVFFFLFSFAFYVT